MRDHRARLIQDMDQSLALPRTAVGCSYKPAARCQPLLSIVGYHAAEQTRQIDGDMINS